MDIFHQSFLRNNLSLDYEIFNNFVFSLKVLQPLMATTEVCELCSLLAIFTLNSCNCLNVSLANAVLADQS